MANMADDGRFSEVCKGTPWVNQPLCNWVAVRAAGTAAGHPDGEIFRAFFTKEHWKRVSGRIVDDAGDNGDYEVAASGYRHHCILNTDETKFETKGSFNMWVQEQPETQEVTVNSGDTQQWVVLEEATLAKQLWDLAHEGSGLESTALAKNAMGTIARYNSYAERKGTLPVLPGGLAHATTTTTTTASAAAVVALPAGSAASTGSAASATSGMADCCAALQQAEDQMPPAANRTPYEALLIGCRMTNDPGPPAARKKQLRDNAVVMHLPPLPAACQ
jgi:hypothetical protein